MEHFDGPTETPHSAGGTQEEREREKREEGVAESEEVEGRVELPLGLESEEVAEVEAVSERLEASVGGGEHGDEEIEEENERDEEVAHHEEHSKGVLALDFLERELAEAPGEESKERLVESSEARNVVENVDTDKSEEEGNEKKNDDEAEEVPEHVLDDGDEWPDSAEYFGLL